MPIDHLPPRMKPAAYRLRAFLMTDATAIIVLGIGILLRGVSYAPKVLGPPPKHGSHPAEAFMDIKHWAVVWIVVGLVCIITPFVKCAAVQVSALVAGVSLNTLWGASFLSQSLITESHRGWVSSVGYFSVVILVLWAVWRGKRGDMPLDIERGNRV